MAGVCVPFRILGALRGCDCRIGVRCLRRSCLGSLRRFRLVGVRGRLLGRRGGWRGGSYRRGSRTVCTRVRIGSALASATWRRRRSTGAYLAYVPVQILAITGNGKPLLRASRLSSHRLWVSGLHTWQGAVGPSSMSRHPLWQLTLWSQIHPCFPQCVPNLSTILFLPSVLWFAAFGASSLCRKA